MTRAVMLSAGVSPACGGLGSLRGNLKKCPCSKIRPTVAAIGSITVGAREGHGEGVAVGDEVGEASS